MRAAGTRELPGAGVCKQVLARLAVLSILTSIAVALPVEKARAQGLHGHEPGESLSGSEIAAALAHSATLWSTVLLAGLVAFAALVWFPVSHEAGGERLFSRLCWALFGILVFAALVELSLYAVRASGESLTPAIFGEALFGTRVGGIWLLRLLLAFSTALVAGLAFRQGRRAYRWLALGLGCVTLMTLTQLSHAAAESRFLPFFADWLHVVAASVWTGGVLGFAVLLLGPFRTRPGSKRLLLGKAVRRFSGVASVAVVVLLVSGIYASLLHLPGFSALIGSPYGRALIMKLGLVLIMLSVGAINMMDRGRDPFGRMVGAELALVFAVFVATGFLTSITPP